MQLPGDISQKPKATEKNITFILQQKKGVGSAADRAAPPPDSDHTLLSPASVFLGAHTPSFLVEKLT